MLSAQPLLNCNLFSLPLGRDAKSRRGALPGAPRVQVIIELFLERVLGGLAVLQDDIGHVTDDERREYEERDDDTGGDANVGADVVEGDVGGRDRDGGGHFFPGAAGNCGFVRCFAFWKRCE